MMLAFHNDQRIKDKYLARVRAHREADELVRGIGWDRRSNRGCAVGCTMDGYEHDRYETELGIPVQLAYLEDSIFENLIGGHLDWPERFLSAIPVGADLQQVWPRFVWWHLDGRANLDRETIESIGRASARAVLREWGSPAEGWQYMADKLIELLGTAPVEE